MTMTAMSRSTTDRSRARGLAKAALILAAAAAVMAPTPEEPDSDPEMEVRQFAHRLGEMEDLASFCRAPPIAYDRTFKKAHDLLPELFRKNAVPADGLEGEIAQGKSDRESGRRIYPKDPCPIFRRLVGSLGNAIAVAVGQPRSPLPPRDAAGWQQRLGGGDAPASPPTEPWPGRRAMTLALQIGLVEALAESCAVPPQSYAADVDAARARLTAMRDRMGIRTDVAEGWIERGRHRLDDVIETAPERLPVICRNFDRTVRRLERADRGADRREMFLRLQQLAE